MTTALGLNAMVTKLPPLVGRIVPFVACCIANGINIPMMRRLELEEGEKISFIVEFTTNLFDKDYYKSVTLYLNCLRCSAS